MLSLLPTHVLPSSLVPITHFAGNSAKNFCSSSAVPAATSLPEELSSSLCLSIFPLCRPGMAQDALCTPATSFLIPAGSRATTLHPQQPCRDSGREKGSICGIDPWICPPALAFLHFPSQYFCFIHGKAPRLFLQCHLGANRAPQIPSRLQAAEPSSGSSASLPHGTCGKLSRQTHRSCCPWHLTGHCSIPEATAHSAGTPTTAPTPNPPPAPSPQAPQPRGPNTPCVPRDGGTVPTAL